MFLNVDWCLAEFGALELMRCLHTFAVRLFDLCLVGAWAACLELAMLAFEDVPMWPRMAKVAVPEYQRGIRLDHLERMVACSAWYCHCCEVLFYRLW